MLKVFFLKYAKWRLKKFKRESYRLKEHQERVFFNILKSVQGTQVGVDFKLKKNISYEEFTKRLPLQTYDSLSSYIDNQKSGQRGQITKKQVKVWERTSGSSGQAKSIPYTSEMFNIFARTIFLWICDLFINGPGLKTWKIFFSLSPQFTQESKKIDKHTLENDSEYLPFLIRFLFRSLFVLPQGLKKVQDPHAYKVILFANLLLNKDLEIIFIWSPSYLISLIEFANSNKEEIIEALRNGQYTYKGEGYNLKNDINVDELRDKWGNWSYAWPKLKLISCWADGSAGLFLPKLKSWFPDVLFQGKGLLATEAPMTIPLVGAAAPVPLYQDIFFEFIDDCNQVFRLHQIQVGQRYKIVISHKSGLLRYQMHDVIEVVDFYHKLPCLRFVGREGNFSDMTGEKLGEDSVQAIFEQILLSGEMALLAPSLEPHPHYICFYDGENKNFLTQLDSKLKQIFHYSQSSKLGQIGPMSLCKVSDVEQLYFDFYSQRGLLLGDIKYSVLFKTVNLTNDFLKFLRSKKQKSEVHLNVVKPS